MRITRMRKCISIFLLMSLPPIFVLIAVSAWLYENEVQNKIDLIKQSQKLQVRQSKRIFESQLSNAILDLLFIQQIDSLRRVVNEPGSSQNENILAHDFKALIEQKKQYDQVRYIDKSGKEVVRVNYRNGIGKTVSETDLQKKGDRYYFKESFSRDEDELYISQMDLNVELGVVELPIKPMIRLAVPVFDVSGYKQGIVIVNYLAKGLMETLQQSNSAAIGRNLLLNMEGYWLLGEDHKDEWGFMFPEMKRITIQNRYPNAWSRIADSESGQFNNENGLFSYATIDSHALIADAEYKQGLTSNKQEFEKWKLVNYVSFTELAESEVILKKRYSVINAILIIIWGLVALLLTRAKFFRIQAGQQLREKEKRIREIVNSAFDAIITINERGIIETFNPAASRMFGYQEEDVIGQKINILMDSPEREYHDLHIQNYIETKTGKFIGKPGRVTGLRNDGKSVDIEICIGAKKIDEHWLFTAICRQYRADASLSQG